MKDKKDRAYTNRIKLMLASIGIAFFALILFIALYEQAPIMQNNTSESNHDNVFTRDNGSAIVSLSADHYDETHALNSKIEAMEAEDKARAKAAAANTTPGTEYYGVVN